MDPQDVLKEFVSLQSSSSSSDEESGGGVDRTGIRKRQRTNKAGSMEQSSDESDVDREDMYCPPKSVEVPINHSRHTRQGLKAVRAEHEKNFLGKRVTVRDDKFDGGCRNGYVTQVVLVPTDNFMLRVTFEDGYWILVEIDSPKLTVHADNAAFVSLSRVFPTILPGQNELSDTQDIQLGRDVYAVAAGSTNVLFQAFPEKGDNILSRLISELVLSRACLKLESGDHRQELCLGQR
uniref:Uncharacterized protein n=1 Tax=Hanusia phi TaxID=3032 RepID=A0A7S0EVJ4_9CRYP|mmetsp:Transcript_3265/g.7888  ORF Transcript_3265/g.7888 Transcript_3265/m.7888 type:complete len:236 (+) Transcript_3265:2728-3435(+)